MKRIYYLIVLIAITALSACNPLDKTYKQIGDLPTPIVPDQKLTLSTTDYGLLPKGHGAKTAFYFKTVDTAKVDIPLILASKFPAYTNKTSVTVTYATPPVTVKLADSLNANTAITLNTTPTNDYVFPAYNGNAANTFSDFSATAALNYLYYKYQTPLPEPSLRVMTYLYFESGKTASSGTLTTDAFLFQGGVWTKIYRVSTAQYTTIGNGLNSWFVAGDASNIPTYLNTFLKSDPTVMATAKVGDVKYVNYRYLTTYQRVLPLIFNGTDWTTTTLSASIVFKKTDGVWVADNTVTYKLTAADYTFINTSPTTANINSATARANVASFGDFNISLPLSTTTGWSDADINLVLVAILTNDFKTAVKDQKFIITYVAYNGATINVTKTFIYDGTTFVVQP